VDLSALNHTELYQMCRRAGLVIPPNLPREDMMALLVNDGPDPIMDVPMDNWRRAIARFVLDHWNTLQNQITCPLKSKDPNSCFGCLDTQVMLCIVQNTNYERQLKNYYDR